MSSPSTVRLFLRPSMFLLHVPAVVAVTIAVLLGVWQMESWQEGRRDRAAEIADAAPVPLGTVLGPDDRYPVDVVGRPVTVAGDWLPEASVAVANKDHDGEDGYWSVALVSTCGTSTLDCAEPAALPVVLGWSAEPATRSPDGAAELTGWLQPGETSEELDTDPSDDVLPALRVSALLERADRDLYGAYLILDTPAEWRDGLVAVTPESLPDPPTFTALRNFLYGIEWWVFAGFAVFLWWRWTRDEVRRVRSREDVALVSAPVEEDRSDVEARLPSRP